MDIRQLLRDDDAVSPVIGVILMVAITVILAAVIATFVLGLGSQVSKTAPQASFSFEWEGSSGGDAPLHAQHSGGETLTAGNLYFRGDPGSQGNLAAPGAPALGETWDYYADCEWSGGTCNNGSAMGPNSEVAAGIRVTLPDIGASGQVSLVWQTATGERSATLADWAGPDA